METLLLVVVLVLVLAVGGLTAALITRRGPDAGGVPGGGPDATASGPADALVSATRAVLAEELQAATRQLVELNEQRLATQDQQAAAQARRAQDSIETLVSPLRVQLTDLDRHVRELERQRQGAYARLDEQVGSTRSLLEALKTETSTLTTALRRGDTRGRWGELQLERVIELAGLTEHVSYERQATQAGDGRGRPDVTIHLTGDRVLFVDAKVPLAAFQDAVGETDPDRRDAHLARHAKALAGHATSLAQRAYTDDPRSLPFVVLFVPTEASLAAACEADPRLLEDALERGIAIASPTSLAMLLTTIAVAWRQQRFHDNATRIVQDVGELHKRLGIFAEHLTKVGDGLGATVKRYNQAVGSLESRLYPAARTIEAHGGAVDRLPDPTPITEVPRPLRAVGGGPDLDGPGSGLSVEDDDVDGWRHELPGG